MYFLSIYFNLKPRNNIQKCPWELNETFHFIWKKKSWNAILVDIIYYLIFWLSVVVMSIFPYLYIRFEKKSVSVFVPYWRFQKNSFNVPYPYFSFSNTSEFRNLFWIFNRTRNFFVPVPLGTDTEKVRIRTRRSG